MHCGVEELAKKVGRHILVFTLYSNPAVHSDWLWYHPLGTIQWVFFHVGLPSLNYPLSCTRQLTPYFYDDFRKEFGTDKLDMVLYAKATATVS